MMKSIFKHLLVFAGLVLAISSFNGCGGQGGAATTRTERQCKRQYRERERQFEWIFERCRSDYPPLVSGLANAEYSLIDGTKFKIADKKGKVLVAQYLGHLVRPVSRRDAGIHPDAGPVP